MADELNWDSLSRKPREARRAEPEPPSGLRKLFAPALAMSITVFKYAAPALKFLPMMLKTGGSMLLSIGAYAVVFGWKFGLGFVLLLLVHELGHSLAAKWFGLKVSAPVFIPFFGAGVVLKDLPPNAWIESVVGFGGPLLGTIGGLLAFAIGMVTGNPLYFALASSAFLLNVFNLVPIMPLDGGHIVTAISPWLWIVGFVMVVPYLLLNLSVGGVYILLLVALSLPRAYRLFKGRSSPESQRYFECTPGQRLLITLAYFGLALFLGIAMTETHDILTAF